MNKKIYDLSKSFLEIHDEEEESKLETVRDKALREQNVDILYTLKELDEIAKFIFVDFQRYDEILDKLDEFLKK